MLRIYQKLNASYPYIFFMILAFKISEFHYKATIPLGCQYLSEYLLKLAIP